MFLRAREFKSLFLSLCLVAIPSLGVDAQSIAKYGAEFLETGVGARALGMGGANIALVNDVTAGYWNVAGLSGLQYPQGAFMHDERFAGVVSYDYGSIAFPVTNRSTFGVTYIRSSVDDIKNTWGAWDPVRDQPRPNPENFITTFNAADYAFLLGYSRALSRNLSLGVTGKIIRRAIGKYSRAWGYSFDLGAQYRTQKFMFGFNIQDASTMLLSWSVNQERLAPLQEVFGDIVPEGGTELILPVARLGSGVLIPLADEGLTNFTVGADLDLRFDGLRTYAIDAGGMSLHPRIGGELNLKGIVAIRGGIGNIGVSDKYGLEYSPSVGAGVDVRQISFDYGFGNFSGLSSGLGYSHRVSFMVTLEQPRLRRLIQ